MKLFVQLFRELEESKQSSLKLAALQRYFSHADPASAAWALWLLFGNRIPIKIGRRQLRHWAADLSRLPDWLIDTCYEHVGDSAETAALLLPCTPTTTLSDSGNSQSATHLSPAPANASKQRRAPTDSAADSPLDPHLTLAEWIEQRLLPLAMWDERAQFQLFRQWLEELPRETIFVVCNVLTGGYRFGISPNGVIRALAAVIGVEVAVLTHRLSGKWEPHAGLLASLCDPAANATAIRVQPYPFYLASPLSGPVEHLGPVGDWLLEWKWDGIRAQIIRRSKGLQIWLHGNEQLNAAFPDLLAAAATLPDETVLDGEIVAWGTAGPAAFHQLQQRLHRKHAVAAAIEAVPVRFIACDCLEHTGVDIRHLPTLERRQRMAALIGAAAHPLLQISEALMVSAWSEAKLRRGESRERGTEGLMIKLRSGGYRTGRSRGEWWSWKCDPLLAAMVLLYAHAGHGRRAGLFGDYTLGVWEEGKLVPVAKACSSLNNAEKTEIDRWIQQHCIARKGPVRTVPPHWVLEIGFDGVQPSSRHKAGLALRNPRILRLRRDKTPEQADTLDSLRGFLT